MAIIKTIGNAALDQGGPAYLEEAYNAGKINSSIISAEYVCLTDTGGIYAINESSDGWWAKLFLADPKTKQRTNIFRMIIGAKRTRETSENYKSLKELKNAIERSHEAVEKVVLEGQGMTEEEYKVFISEVKRKAKPSNISLNSKTSDTDTNDDGAFTTGCITLIGIVVVIAIIIIATG